MSRRFDPPEPDPTAGLPPLDERICDWVDGCMSERERDRFEAELRIRPELRRQLEEYEATVADVRAALQAPTADVPLADRVMATIASGAGADAAAARRRWPMVAGMFAAAAALAVVVWLDGWAGRADTIAVAVADGAPPVSADSPAAEPLAASAPAATLDAPKASSGPEAARRALREAPVQVEAGLPPPAARLEQQRDSAGRFGGRAGRERGVPPSDAGAASPPAAQPRGPEAGGPAGLIGAAGDASPGEPSTRVGAAAAAEEVVTRLELQLQGAARAKLTALREVGPPRAPAALFEGVRGWFAREGLRALSTEPGAAPARTQLGGVSLAPLRARVDGARAWLLEGPQEDVAILLGLLATAAREVGGVVERGEEALPAPTTRRRAEPPSPAKPRPPLVDRARVVLRIRGVR